jgi:hypothetical protein
MMVSGRQAQNVQVNPLDGIFGTHRSGIEFLERGERELKGVPG